MIHAYAESYLDDAMKNLGEAFDYAVNACHMDIDEFMNLFITSGYADNFGNGNPKIVSGLSGTELVMEIIKKTGKKMKFPEEQVEYDYSPEYWCGWILAFFQWKTGRPFRDIMSYISVEGVLRLYPTLHEAAEDKFVDTLNAILSREMHTTRLQRRRKQCGYSQSELSKRSGVNLRTLQQYESGTKDINKAAVITIMALAKALDCKIEDLMQYQYDIVEKNR